jgi:outer membrane murein-binding lipoprotein Lpp
MRRLGSLALIISVSLLWLPAAVLGQEGLSNEQLKRAYDDAVVQLKTAQDRRNELARESEKLKARITQLEKDLEQSRSAANALADKTFQVRAEHAAFTDFLRDNPAVRVQWQLFLEKNLLACPDAGDLIDHDWPLPAHR